MADGNTRQGGTSNGSFDLRNVARDDIRSRSGVLLVQKASGGNAVEVLGAHADSGHAASKRGTVCGDGRLEGLNLTCNDCITCRAPDSEQKGGLGGNGGRNGLDGRVGCASLAVNSQYFFLSIWRTMHTYMVV